VNESLPRCADSNDSLADRRKGSSCEHSPRPGEHLLVGGLSGGRLRKHP